MAQFCTECGTKLPDAAKFCSACGTRVAMSEPAAAPAPPEVPLPEGLRARFESARSELRGDRREVAVLFADLQGFTSMSETMDPEEVTLLLNPLLVKMADAIHGFEGYVDKFLGDGVMALFGAPIAHENDPERAVHAGLAMLEIIERYNEKAEVPLALRVGINLGSVVAAQLGSEMRLQYTVLGDTVNVASRLEGAAEPNTVLVSERVHERIAGKFAAEEVPPLTLKGVSEPLRAFRITGAATSAERERGGTLPFIGRTEELATVDAFLSRAWDGSGGVLVIEAGAGTGKSRLVQEALSCRVGESEIIEIDFAPIHLPGRVSVPVGLWRELFGEDEVGSSTAALELLGGQADEHHAGVESLLREIAQESASAPESEDPQSARQNRWLAIVALVEARARHKPLTIVIEDVHWADEGEQEFLAHFSAAVFDGPIAIVATSRPGADLAWLPDRAERLDIHPLDDETAAEILGEQLDDLAPEVRRDLIHRSAGNPLFLEELVRALREQSRQGRSTTGVPGTLQGLIMSRIDRLPASQQTLIQMAAVLGNRFSERLLDLMYALEPHPVAFEDAVSALESENFLMREDGDLRFQHALMQEVAYGGLLARVRRVLHESAAQIGEEHFAENPDAEAAFFGHHYWHAGLPEKASPHLWIAGRRAADGFDLPAAERFLGRVATTLDANPDAISEPGERARFDETYGEVLMHRGKLDVAETWFEQLESLGTEHDRPDWVARALERRGRAAWYRGQLDEAIDLFERGLSIIPESEPLIIADIRNDLGVVYYYRGRPDEAVEHHQAALDLRQSHEDHAGTAKSLSNIGNVLLDLRSDLDGAEGHYRRALETAEEIGDRQMTCMTLNNLARVSMERGDWASALATLQRADRLLEDIGWTYARFVTLQNRTFCEIALGKLDEAFRHLEICSDGDDVLEPVNRINTRLSLFDAAFQALDDDRARAALDDAARLVETLGVEEQKSELYLREGRWLASMGEWAAAAEKFEEARSAAEASNLVAAQVLAEAHLKRASARSGAALPEMTTTAAPGNRSLQAIATYLEADADVEVAPSEALAEALAEAANIASELGEIALERAAAERLAAVRIALGDGRGGTIASTRAIRALRALERNLPAEVRASFGEHPRNSALLAEDRERAPQPD